jgi:exodeoxyribonuclease III
LSEISFFYRPLPLTCGPKVLIPEGSGEALFDRNGMANVCTYNVNSLRAYVKSPYSSGFLMNPHDVIGFSEIQADLADVGHNVAIVKYARKYGHCYWHVCGYNPTYAGTAIFSRLRPCMVIFGFHESLPPDGEGRIITARYQDCSVIMVYAPAKPDPNLCFLRTLIDHAVIEKARGKPVILLGDLNVPREPADVSDVQSWVESPFDYCDHRVVLECLIATLGVDAGQREHAFTWYPQPNKANQARKIGMRIDYILHCSTLVCDGSRPTLPPCLAIAPLTSILPPTSLPIEEETRIIQQFGRMAFEHQLEVSTVKDHHPNQYAISQSI